MTYKELTKSQLTVPAGNPGKNIVKYAERVYKTNKNIIDVAAGVLKGKAMFGTENIPQKDWFIAQFTRLAQKNPDMKWSEIVHKFGNSRNFVDKYQSELINSVRKLRNDAEAFKAFRMAIGWKNAIDYGEFKRDPYEKSIYRYKDIIISFESSPEITVLIDRGV